MAKIINIKRHISSKHASCAVAKLLKSWFMTCQCSRMLSASTWTALRQCLALLFLKFSHFLYQLTGVSLTSGTSNARKRWLMSGLGSGCVLKQRILFNTRQQGEEGHFQAFNPAEFVAIFNGYDSEKCLMGDDVTLMAIEEDRAYFAYTPGIDVYNTEKYPFLYT